MRAALEVCASVRGEISKAAGPVVWRPRRAGGMELPMRFKYSVLAMAGVVFLAGSALAGTFGKVVTIGGEAADVALDEARGVLYIANFTANRIEVMSLATNTVQTSINVPQQPNGISLSPDGHWL